MVAVTMLRLNPKAYMNAYSHATTSTIGTMLTIA